MRARSALIIVVAVPFVAFLDFLFYVDPVIVTVSFLVLGFIAIGWILSKKFLDSSKHQLATCFTYIAVGLYSVLIGLFFWNGFDTVYETSFWLNIPPECCGISPTPTLPSGIALIPWLLLLGGTMTMFSAVRNTRFAEPLSFVTVGLVLASTLPNIFYGFGDWTGWPFAWWGHTFTTCATCTGPPLGYAVVSLFLVDVTFWSLLVAFLTPSSWKQTIVRKAGGEWTKLNPHVRHHIHPSPPPPKIDRNV